MVNPDIFTGRLGNRLFQIAYLYAQVKEGKIPDWYVQDYHHFEKYEKEIKELFGEGIGYLPYVAIHLRVGTNPINPSEPKYSENPFYVNLSKTGYYIKALEHFPHDKFIVFSDDVAFAKTYFEGDRFTFDESENDIDSFNKFASCQGHIIANSSWSWWASFCCPHPNSKTLFPSLWFNDTIKRVKFPKEWVEIGV